MRGALSLLAALLLAVPPAHALQAVAVSAAAASIAPAGAIGAGLGIHGLSTSPLGTPRLGASPLAGLSATALPSPAATAIAPSLTPHAAPVLQGRPEPLLPALKRTVAGIERSGRSKRSAGTKDGRGIRIKTTSYGVDRIYFQDAEIKNKLIDDVRKGILAAAAHAQGSGILLPHEEEDLRAYGHLLDFLFAR